MDKQPTLFFQHNNFIEPYEGPQIAHERRFFYPSLGQLAGFYEYKSVPPESYFDSVGNFWMGFSGNPSVAGHPTYVPRVALFTFAPVSVKVTTTSDGGVNYEGDIDHNDSHYNAMAGMVIDECMARAEEFRQLKVSVCVSLNRFAGCEPLGYYVWDPGKISIFSLESFPTGPTEPPDQKEPADEPTCNINAIVFYYPDTDTTRYQFVPPDLIVSESPTICFDDSPIGDASSLIGPNAGDVSFMVYHSHYHPWINFNGLVLPPYAFGTPGYPITSSGRKQGGDLFIGTYINSNHVVTLSYDNENNPFNLYRKCFNRVYINKTKSFFVPEFHTTPEDAEQAEKNTYYLKYRIDGEYVSPDGKSPGYRPRREPFIPTYHDATPHFGHAYLDQGVIPSTMVQDAIDFFQFA